MFAGKRFRLTAPILAVNVEGHTKGSTAGTPVGAVVEVVSGATDGDGMVDVLWEGRTVAMFAIDLNVRGTELLT